jgi:LPS-assembly lipoprotein
MSSSETPAASHRPNRRGAALLVALSVAVLAGGCFRPLYAENTASTVGGSVRSALRAIDFPEIKGLIGHYLRNELVFEFDGGNEPDAPKTMKFETGLSDSVEVVSVDYANGRADSAVLNVTATWKVTRIGSGEVLSSGTNSVREPYERSSQRFAVIRAARDAQIRAAKNLAGLIRGQISADLTR